MSRPSSKAFLQVLWNGCDTSIPCLFLFTDRKRYIFNCCEGLLRLFNQRRMKISTIDQFFLTRYQWSHMGGLPGVGMTLKDIKQRTMQGKNKPILKKGKASHKARIGELISEPTEGSEKSHKVSIYAPQGMSTIMDATKPFLRYTMSDIKFEVAEQQKFEDEEITIHSIPIYGNLDNTKAGNTCHQYDYVKAVNFLTPCSPSFCYVCQLCPIPGKFNTMNAKKLGVPTGPLFAKLKGGETVELDNGTKVTPEQVLGPEIPGPKFLIIDCPSVSYIENLIQNKNLSKFLLENEGVYLVVHLSPQDVCQDNCYGEWTRKFPSFTKHIYLNELVQESPIFETQHNLQIMLNHIDSKIFPLIVEPKTQKLSENSLKNFVKIHLRELMNDSTKVFDNSEVQSNVDHSSLISRVNKILNMQASEYKDGEISENDKTCILGKRTSGEGLDPVPHKKFNFEDAARFDNTIMYPKIICLGTGASNPSTYRNVSATLLFVSESSAVLLDCGEDTYGQLLRHYGDNVVDILLKIKFIFISHVHPDHHLGLITLISKINKLRQQINESLIIMAPRSLLLWLTTYAGVSESLRFKFINCEDAYGGFSVQEDLEVQTVKVNHPGYAHGIVLKYNDMKITYSGDTMPWQSLINAGMNSKLLIHEATHEDKMIKQARDAKHSTIRQALEVSQKMNAEYVLLTHFGQRYPKLPLLKDNLRSSKTAFAFDHLEITLNDIPRFSKLLPILDYLLQRI